RHAEPLGRARLACELAALLSERDIARSAGGADMRLRVAALRGGGMPHAQLAVDAAACRRVRAEAQSLQRQLGAAQDTAAGDALADCGVLLGFAYPDRIAALRSDGRYLLRNGRGAAFAAVQPLSNAAYLAVAELDDQGVDSRIQLAAPLTFSDLERHFADQIEVERSIAWDAGAKAVRARKRTRLGAIVLNDVPLQDPDPDEVLAALLDGFATEGLRMLPWNKSAFQLRERLQFLHRQEPDAWADVSDASLTARDYLAEWLGPHCYGMKNASDLSRLHMTQILESMLNWDQRRELDACAPTHIVVPSGSRIPVDYGDPEAPILAVRLQEMFGLHDTPRIAHGKVPVTLHLLSPAQRPVQVTRDLANFWRETYFEVRKDLKGRYPKHYWPDDPSTAVATQRVRPRTT
ncbi:ATP-dependent helicase HrpB, partial [Paenibacillus selenitireducens]